MSKTMSEDSPAPLSAEELQHRIEQLEEELRKVTANFSRALEQGNAVVYSRNFDSLTYEYMGEGIKDITGYTQNEMTPALFDSISISAEPLGELSELPLDEAYRRNRTGVNNRWVADTQIRTKSGEIKYILDMSTTMVDRNGHCYGTLGIMFDITDRKCMEQELVQTTDELKRKNDEMEQDMETAHEIQMTLLARAISHFPTDIPKEKSSVRFSNLYIPAKSLSGDFFYILPVSDTIVGVLIGDVMGHGVRAALISAFLRGLIQEIKPFAQENGLFMQKLNYGLCSITSLFRTGSFVTAIYLTVDIENKILRYANAGHPEPVCLNRSHPDPVLVSYKKSIEPALGLIEDFCYSSTSHSINHDDVIHLFTDGVHDVKNENGDFYGKERFLSFITNNHKVLPQTLLENFLADITKFAGTQKDFDDDLCIVSLHIVDPIKSDVE